VKPAWNKGTRLAIGLVDKDVAMLATPAKGVFDETLGIRLAGGAAELQVENNLIQWVVPGLPWR
jgi:hypothetical protein